MTVDSAGVSNCVSGCDGDHCPAWLVIETSGKD